MDGFLLTSSITSSLLSPPYVFFLLLLLHAYAVFATATSGISYFLSMYKVFLDMGGCFLCVCSVKWHQFSSHLNVNDPKRVPGDNNTSR